MSEQDKHQADEEIKPVTRRDFFQQAGVVTAGLGAGLLLKQQEAIAGPREAHPRTSREANRPSWPAKFEPISTAPPYYPRQLPQPGEKIHEYDIELTVAVHEIIPGVKVHQFAYNGSVPGPEIRVPEGDWVLVNFTNKTTEFHTIHWHGIMLANEMDGVPNGTQWGTGMNQTFRYLYRAQPAGTHFYHCHNMTQLHVQSGMYGALIIEPKKDIVKETFPYEREYTMVLSEIDTGFVESQMNEMLTEMGLMQSMMENKKLMSEMNGRMMGWFYDKQSYIKAIREGGYIPPYSKARTGLPRSQSMFNYFMINGKSYPMTEDLMIRRGENIRVRMINAGMLVHNMHLHGHDFWHVCTDGSPLAAPVRLNTVPVFPGSTVDIVIQGTNPGHWHFHDHSDLSTTNNGQFPGGMMTMLMYEDADRAGVKFKEVIQVSS